MSKTNKYINASEMLEILSHQWATTEDVKKIAYVGTNKALEIKKKIKEELEKKNFYLPPNLVPMEELIKYLNINISYLQKISKNN